MTVPALNGSSPPTPAEVDRLALKVDDLVQEFRVRRRGEATKATVSAVDGVSLEIPVGQTYAIVGETGSGKSTFARAVIGVPPPKAGRVVIAGEELSGKGRRTARRRGELVQMVFQDPTAALDPKWSARRIVGEPLRIRRQLDRASRAARVNEMLSLVGLDPMRFGERRASELSGGQAQRVAIARALVASPQLVICDEPVTALDVSIQAQILSLLYELKREFSLTYLLIAHDLAVVRILSDRVGTMYLGTICEEGATDAIFNDPAHPYTVALLSAIPKRHSTQAGTRIRLLGEPPSPFAPPSGCRFRTRCAYAQDLCAHVKPELRELRPGHKVACHFPLTRDGYAPGHEPGRRDTGGSGGTPNASTTEGG